MPDETVSGAETARRSGIPGEVVVEKMGVREKCICSPEEDYATDMYAAAEAPSTTPRSTALTSTSWRSRT